MPRASVACAWGSRSTTSTPAPSAARQPARLTVVVVFPQPPFWFTMAMIRMIPPAAENQGSMHPPSDPAGGAGRARRRYAALRLLAASRAKSSDSGARARAERSHILSPGIDLAHELSDLEDPLLPGNCVKRGTLADHQHHIASGHQHELGKRLLDGGQKFAERLDAAADALHGDACIDQAPRRLERDQVLEAVPVVSSLGEGGGSDKVGLCPVLQLATGEPEDLRNIAGPIGAAAAIGQGT